jgi:hypothetical protein
VSLSTVETALLTAVATPLTSISTCYENVQFDPPAAAKWARVFFMPNTPEVETLGAAGEDMVTGLLQVDMSYPQNAGTSAPRADYETMRATFYPGARFTSSTQAVMVTSFAKSGGRLVDQWYRVSFTVYWYALIPR